MTDHAWDRQAAQHKGWIHNRQADLPTVLLVFFNKLPCRFLGKSFAQPITENMACPRMHARTGRLCLTE